MKLNFRKLSINKHDMLYILLIILLILIGYNIFVHLYQQKNESANNGYKEKSLTSNLGEDLSEKQKQKQTQFGSFNNVNEGLYNLARQQHVILRPVIKPGVQFEWLNINEITLYDPNNNKIPYTATSTTGIYQNMYWFDTPSLYDSNMDTMYVGGAPGTTLSLNPTNPKSVVSKIVIINRQDCCQDRLKAYKLFVEETNGANEIASFELINLADLYDSTKGYKTTIKLPTYDNENVITIINAVT
jgi:hypothetical protein